MNFFGKAGGTAASPIQFLADAGAVLTHAATVGTNASLAGINLENAGGYYVFQGLTINSDGSMNRAGIRVAATSHVQLINNKVDSAYIGIFTSNATDLLLQGNVCSRSTDQHGIYIGAGTTNSIARGNECWGNNWDGIHMNASNAIGPNNGNLIEGNKLHDNDLSGMDIEGVTNAILRDNLIYNNTKHGMSFHSQDQTRAGNPTPVCANNTIVNNTITGNGLFGLVWQPEDMAGTVVFNNILLSASTTTYGSIGVSGSSSGLTSDYNIVNDSFSSTLGTSEMSLASWRSNSGQDAHSVVATPSQLFVNASGGDYRLKAGSPAIDSGVASLGGRAAPTTDYAGAARPQGSAYDAGAFEYASTPDTTAPTISGVGNSTPTSSGATVSWNTDEAADTQVEYGLTTSYGSSTALNAVLGTSHSAGLSGLAAGTTYHFRVKSRDAAGNLATSADFTFTTAPADTTGPTVSGVGSSGVSGTGATVAWTTNEAADTQVEYGSTTSYGSTTTLNGSMVTSHSAALGGLTANTVYHYRVRSRDAAGNLTVSGDFTFTTSAPDVTPPTVSNVASSGVSVSGATVAWTTNEAADSQVEYGTTTSYGSSTTLDPTKLTSHSVTVGGLSPSTLYHFRVKTKDAAGNQTVSADFTFTTADAGQFPAGVIGFWQFNETSGTSASDASGNGNTGTLVNGPTFVAGRDSGNALNFDGTNDQVRVTRSGALEPAKVSLSAWVRLAAGVTQDDWATIIKKTYDNDNSEPFGTYSLQLSPGGQGNFLTFHTGHAGDGNDLISAAPIATGQWVHLAATYDPATGEKRLYVNGTQVASATLTSALVYDTSSAGNLYIGQDPGAGEAFQGAIDDVGVWGRALTAAEVQTLAFNGADTTGPTISSVSSSSVTNGGATVSWSTNEASDTQVQYGTTTAYGSNTTLNSTKVTSHGVSLTGLAASTTYHYRVLSRDAAGNLTVSADFTFTTAAAPDTTAPTISGVGSSGLSSSGATVAWTTDEASDTQVEYGTSTSYGSSSTLNSSKVTSHSATLSGLQPSTTYHFRVKSRDAAGNLATSADFTFTTAAAPDTTAPVISGVTTSGLSSGGVTISWTTNEAADTQVQYGTTTSYGSTTTLDTTKVTSHGVTLTGLTPGTVYHFRVKSRDAAGNLRNSADFTFTTATVGLPGQLRFSSATYTTAENGGGVLVTVTRTGGTTGSVSVSYATGDDTATAGSDYTATSGMLTFADGETEKTFTILITDDALAEDAESLNLTLSNPTGGATLGGQSTATVTVNDDDPPAEPGSNGLANGIAYDASGTMYMAYFDDATDNLKFASRSAGGTWSAVDVVDGGQDMGMYLSVAVDSAGHAGIAYMDGTNADLRYAHFNGTSWDVQVVDSKYTTGYYPSVKFGANDRPVISYYYKTGGDMRVAAADASGWTLTTIDASGDVGRYSTLALNPLTGRWSLGYEDTTHGTFKYAEQTKRGWSSLTIDAATKIGGGYISMAFNPVTKQPAMSYYDAYNADLKFAAFNGKRWVAQTVASKGSIGLYSNLRIRPDGNAEILYYNKGANGVFRAQVGSSAWALDQVASDGGRWLSTAEAPNGGWTASWLSDTGITTMDL
jgi:hypothetical protein